MKRIFLAAAFVVIPAHAWACTGAAAMDVAISYDGSKYTVTNIGKASVVVTFQAWAQSYTLTLAPGQAGTPMTGGIFNLPMKGYQSCTATPVAAPPLPR